MPLCDKCWHHDRDRDTNACSCEFDHEIHLEWHSDERGECPDFKDAESVRWDHVTAKREE